MKIPLAALAMQLMLSSAAFAQAPFIDPQTLAELQKAIDEARKKQAAKIAAEAKKPKAFADRKVIERLTDRLDRDGIESAVAGPWVARTYFSNGAADKSGAFSNHVVSLIERDLPSPKSEDGSITFLVMRKELSHLQATRQEYTPLPGGLATVEEWAFRVELDGRISACTRTTRTGKVVGPREISADPKDGYVEKEDKPEPASAQAVRAWKRLEKFLPFMGRSYEV